MSILWELLFPFAGSWPRLFICSCLVYLHSWTHGPVGTLDHWASLNFMVKKAPCVYVKSGCCTANKLFLTDNSSIWDSGFMIKLLVILSGHNGGYLR